MKKFLLLLLSICSLQIQAQKKIIHKYHLDFGTGLAQTSGDKILNKDGVNTQLFTGFKSGFGSYLNFNYNFTHKFSLGLGGEYVHASQEKSALSKKSISLLAKLYLIRYDKPVSPYFLFSLQSSSVDISRDASNAERFVNGSDIAVVYAEKRLPTANFQNLKAVGGSIGFGTNMQITREAHWFFQVNYNLSKILNTTEIAELYPESKTDLKYIFLSVGLRFNFKKSTSIYK